MLGPCAGGAAYSPALTDFVFMVRESSQMFITGPDVVRAVTGEEISQNGLGGADVHASVSGVAAFAYDDEESCLEEVRYLLSMLPQNNRETAPVEETEDPADRSTDALLDLVPGDPNCSYDMRQVIEEIVDDHDFFEVQPTWATNIICALARLDGHVVGIVANQPASLAGVLDIHASEKAARFVQTCDAFNIPLVSLVDVPGSCPASTRNTAASSGTAPSCSTRTATPPSRASRSSCARRTAARTSSWTPAPSAWTSRSPGPATRSP